LYLLEDVIAGDSSSASSDSAVKNNRYKKEMSNYLSLEV